MNIFDTSKIDYSGFQPRGTGVCYDSTEFQNEGLLLKFCLDPNNPEYAKVINECETKNINYRITDGEGNQKHIWIDKDAFKIKDLSSKNERN